jgi:hypothetical protein
VMLTRPETGTNIVEEDTLATIFVPPTLTYIYVGEMPVLLEGSRQPTRPPPLHYPLFMFCSHA